MEKLKKILSLLLAAAFVTAAMPLSGLTSAAEVPELALSDGSVWLADLGSDAVLDVNSAGDYKITTGTDASANANFKLMPKTRFSALTDSVALSCDYRADATSFGFKTDYSLDGLRGNSNEYGSVEFYRVEAGNSTTIQMYVNGSAVDIKNFTATRATLRDIRIIEQNGSYYVKYGDWVLDGTGLSEEIQNAVKLENYFPRELLANNGMLYFFCTAVSISSGNGARIIIHNSFGDRSRNYSHTISEDANTPSAWVITPDKAETTYNSSDGSYSFSARAGGTMSSFGIPVTTVTKGETESKSFKTWNTFSAKPAGDRYNYFDFSNDPTFAEDSTETVSVIYVPDAGETAHVAYGGTTIGCLNMLLDSGYTWYFTSDGTNVTGLDIHSGTYGGTFTGFNKLQVGKPIYLRIRKYYYDDGLTLTSEVKVSDSTLAAQVDALNESVNTAAASDDVYTAKTAVNAFYESELRYAASYEAEAKASDILIAYNNQIKDDAEKVDSAVNALPPVDELIYQDKATIEAVRAMFDALNNDAKALVKTRDTLIEYEKAAESLVEDDGRYRTSDGSVYRVVYDPEGISLGSDEVNGALKTSVVGDASNSKSELGVVTGKKFPIVSGKYEMSQYFGIKDNSGRFGFAADDDENIFEGGYRNSFIMYRTENKFDTKLYTLIDGKTQECYSCTATRARLWTIGVTKQDGSWYVTVDGNAITGEGYSDEVKESLKLENHFSAEFLKNNYSVHFFMYASSMHGAAYLRPTVSVENNLVLDVRDRMNDPNSGVEGIVEKNVVNSSLTVSESGNVYNFDVPSVGSVILSEPLNKDGFSIKASMPLLSGNQWVYYTFSNDPDFLSGDEVEVVIVQFANTDGQNTVWYNGAERTDRFSGFYGGSVTRKLSFVNDGGVYKLRLFTEGSDVIVSSPDFASLMKKPIYLKVTGDAYTEPNITITNHVSDNPAYTDSAALDQATEAYLAKEATVLGASIDSEISEIYSDKINFVYNKDKADALLTKLSTLSNRQKSEVKNSAQLYEINNYLISLANTDAESLVVCRRLLLGSIEWTAGNYDFYHDDSIDILDMIRMKKIIAEIEKKK